MSQSAVSGALADLERQFDVQLFDRAGQAPAAERAGPGRARPGRGDPGPGPGAGAGAGRPQAGGPAAHRGDADHRQLPGGAADGPVHARAPGRRADAGGGQHRGDRPPGGELRDRRRADRGRDRARRPGHHPLARRRAGGVLRRRPPAGAQAQPDRRRPARGRRGSCASPARAPARPSTGPCTGCCPSCTSPWSCSTPRPSRGRWRPAWASAASRASPLQDAFRSGTLRACRVPQRDFRRQFFFLLHKQKYRSAGIQRWLELCRAQPTG